MRILYIKDGPKFPGPWRRGFQDPSGQCELDVVSGAGQGIARLEDPEPSPYDLAFADVSLSDLECVGFITYVRQHCLPIAVIVSARQGDDARVLASLGAGADCIVRSDRLRSDAGTGGTNLSFISQISSLFEESLRGNASQMSCELLETVIKSLSARVGVLDQNGIIIYESKSWPAMINGSSGDLGWTAVGANYLQACKRVAADGDVYAEQALDGIEAVLTGRIPTFALEYPFQRPGQRPGERAGERAGSQGWCLMQVDAMPSAHGGVVISHTDVTNLKQAEASLRKALSEVEQLKNQLQQENLYLKQEITLEHYPGEIIGQSAELRRVLQQVDQVASTDTTVLILGETGTGKELVARAIHHSSSRKNRPLVKVNCAALPSTLIESELFGHEKGAFTGAQARKIGRFEVANGGTLMLDEIGELPPELQAKLLRVLQEGEFERLGSSNTIQVNVRVIAATNRDLKQDVQEGRFRADLWYRLNIFPITMPPLRDRIEDIRLLINHFVIKFSKKVGKRFSAISPAAIKALESYGWPGNVRELASVIERAVIVSSGPVLTLADKLDSNREAHTGPTGRMTLESIERDCITNRLEDTGWKIDGKGGAAESLGINPSTLRSRMIKLGIRTPQRQYARNRS